MTDDNNALTDAVLIDAELTSAERATVMARLETCGHGPNKDGKVGSRSFTLEAKRVLSERTPTAYVSDSPRRDRHGHQLDTVEQAKSKAEPPTTDRGEKQAMTIPTINDARELGTRRNLDGVVLITFAPDGRLSWTSWGRDRARCQGFARAAARLENEIGQILADEVV